MKRRCLGCGKLQTKTRCSDCRPIYGAHHRRRKAELLAAEPWCHRPGGCPHDDSGTPTNPLVRDHHEAGNERAGDRILCLRCNSERGGGEGRW